jgi:CheY-like chemotaxis protein/anti-sigma regulatory factor (Ser/Thr protein kinase)
LSRLQATLEGLYRIDGPPEVDHFRVGPGEVVELFRARARTRGLGLSLHLEPDHPRGVLVDDLRLQQVVQNLVSNAVKYTERGEVRLRLAGAPTEAGQVRVRITVEDTGPGISPDAARKLFSAFSQARPRTDRAKGSGLGLALCKQFVELMGGTLTFQTELQRGTTFCVELTLAAADEPVPRPPPQPLAPPLEAPARPLKVLVVDDNEVNLKVASSLVARLGHAVEVARDGRQALAAIASASPDVVLMDCHMPVLDGLEATRQLRASGDLRPVIAVTASVYAEDQARCQEAGMDRFLSKPLSLGALQSALADLPRVPQSWPSQAPTTPRALVVEDDPLMRVASVRMLRAEGYSVRDAGNVEAALLDFQRGNPDYLLVDLVLGDGEDGLRLAARMRERRASLKVVVTSGMHLSQSQHAWLEEIGGRFLPKPYTQEDLVEALRRCTGHARLPGSPPAEP